MSTKVLVFNGHCWDASTPEGKTKALMSIFLIRHRDGFYEGEESYAVEEHDKSIAELNERIHRMNERITSEGQFDDDEKRVFTKLAKEYESQLNTEHYWKNRLTTYFKAKAGDPEALEELLRQDIEYEDDEWRIYTVEDYIEAGI
jgi:hypothetical protein